MAWNWEKHPSQTGKGESLNAEVPLNVLTLQQSGLLLAWVQNANDNWVTGGTDAEVLNGRIRLSGIEAGSYRATWISGWDAVSTDAGTVEVTGSTAELDVPAFQHDIALRLVKQAD